jgi:hypothetical protein
MRRQFEKVSFQAEKSTQHPGEEVGIEARREKAMRLSYDSSRRPYFGNMTVSGKCNANRNFTYAGIASDNDRKYVVLVDEAN